jgi:ribosomal protein L37AE/L43A
MRPERPPFAPKVPVGWIVRLYRRDALALQGDELLDKVAGRLYARCRDVLLVSDSRLVCPRCQTEFMVPWIGQPADRPTACPGCGWTITAGAYHASFEHQDLLGINARPAFARYVERYPLARGYRARMVLVDELVHAVHASGGLAARNLLDGRPRRVLGLLDELAGRGGGG